MKNITTIIRNFIAEHPNYKFADIAHDSDLPGDVTCGEIWKELRELADPECNTRDRILIEGEEDHETFRLRPGDACYTECVQEITIQCYKKLYDRMDELDHVQILRDIRRWAQEFEDWWWQLPESTREDANYWDAIDTYCASLLGERITRESNLQEFTADAICREHYDDCYGYMLDELNMSREDAFAKIREWADEFWADYSHRNIFDECLDGASYYDLVDAFIDKKAKSMREGK